MSKKLRRSLEEKEFVVAVRLCKKDFEKLKSKSSSLKITKSLALRIAISNFINTPNNKFEFLK